MDIAWFTHRNGAYVRTSVEACRHLEVLKLDMTATRLSENTKLISNGQIGYSNLFEDELGSCRVMCHDLFDYYEMRGTKLFRVWKKVVALGIPATPGYDMREETFRNFIDAIAKHRDNRNCEAKKSGRAALQSE